MNDFPQAADEILGGRPIATLDAQNGRRRASASDEQVAEQGATGLTLRHRVQSSRSRRVDAGQSRAVELHAAAIAEQQVGHHLAVGIQMRPRPGTGADHHYRALVHANQSRHAAQIVQPIPLNARHQIRNAAEIDDARLAADS